MIRFSDTEPRFRGKVNLTPNVANGAFLSPVQVASLPNFASNQIQSSETMESRPRDSSHQPLEDSHFFDTSSGQILLDTPDSFTKTGTSARDLSEKDILEAITAIGGAISEMQSLKNDIERFYFVNSSLVEELLDQNCADLAEQKRQLAESERFLLERLERLSSSSWSLDHTAIPWA